MIIDISSKVPDDKSEYSKIQLVGDSFKELNLSPEEELIVKKYLYYSSKLHNHSNADSIELSVAYQILIQIIFDVFNKYTALAILKHLGDDLVERRYEDAWRTVDHIRQICAYANK